MHCVEVREELTGVSSALYHVVSGTKLVIRLGACNLTSWAILVGLYLISKQ